MAPAMNTGIPSVAAAFTTSAASRLTGSSSGRFDKSSEVLVINHPGCFAIAVVPRC